MMNCKRLSRLPVAVLLFMFILSIPTNSDATYPNEEKIGREVRVLIFLEEWGGEKLIFCFGSSYIEFSDPYPDPIEPDLQLIDVELTAMDLRGPGITIRLNDDVPSTGSVRSINPGADFPAESFFDIFIEIEIDELPGDTISNYDPLRISSTIDQWPPYFENYIFDPFYGTEVPLYRKDGTPAGFLYWWEEEVRPYYEPEAHLHIPTAYMSDVALLQESGPMPGTIRLSASVSGSRNIEVLEATFAYRHCGDTDPFTVFWIDSDGSGQAYSTIYPLGPGDGLVGYFEPGSEPFEGQCVEFEVSLLVPQLGILCDTVTVFVDPTPPIPSFHNFETDSVGYFQVDSFFDIFYTVDDEFFSDGTAELWLFPLSFEYHRDLTEIDQLGLGTDHDSTSCAPTAAASCLKYFADNGHPDLDNPKGDENKPEQSDEDMARELGDAMGTDENGTNPDEMVSGIEKYLKNHGKSGWTVEHCDVEDDTDMGEMFREFESDSEDVLLLIQDTTAAGDTIGHVVTLGSVTTTYYEVLGPIFPFGVTENKLDFMDPWGGGSTADNEYDVGENDAGQPTTSGYDLNGQGGDGWVCGYIKVSPPDDAGTSMQVGWPVQTAASRAGWILADAGVAHGNGIIDVLHWDTTPFSGGLYLMEVVTVDDQGIECRDLRLAGIPAFTVGDDTPEPPFKTMLRGSYPNPFNPTTTIEFSLRKKTRVTLVVYDVSGRRVRTLLSGETTEEGIHTISWDGRNDKGKQLSSGIYFCKFLAEGQIEARKLILLR